MSPNGSIGIALRVLHIAATCTSLGGLFYARMVLWPNLSRLPDAEREPFLRAMIRRYATIKWSGVTVVAITGVIQWIITWPLVTNRSLYVTYFAVKMAGAVGLFSITFLLALPAEKLRGMQRHRAFWSGLNILCGLTILVGAALMRSVVKIIPEANASEPTKTADASPTTSTSTSTTTTPTNATSAASVAIPASSTAGAVADPFTHDASILVEPDAAGDPFAPATTNGAPVTTAKTSLDVVSMNVTGPLAREVVTRVVASCHPSILACYELASKSSPGFASTIGVDFEITATGAVTNASGGSGTIVPSGSNLLPCVLAVFRQLTFPAPEGAMVHVSYVMQLSTK